VIRLITKYPGLKVTTTQLEAEFDRQLTTQHCAPHDQTKDARSVLQQGGFNLDDLLMCHTQTYIDAAMELAQGNVSEAAKLLGIARTTLYSRIEAVQKHKAQQTQSRGN
jgi:two-component system nitrogen regulation response regulator GlnG